jgi:hypothetical protein
MYIIGIVALAHKFRFAGQKFVRLFLLVGSTHLFFTFVYYFYTLSNVADSIGYYRRVLYLFNSWSETFGQGDNFIYLTLYPLVKFIGLTYFGCFFVYSFFGLLGFLFLLKIIINITQGLFSKWFYILLLPNLHFWSVAIGKDSLIFFGISLLLHVYFLKKKVVYYLFPLLLIGLVRLHILFFILVSFGAMQILLKKGISIIWKSFIFLVLGSLFYLLFPFLMERVGFEETKSVFSQFENLAGQRIEGGSSIYMGDKPLWFKWISYMFRPFFYDAYNITSIVVSVENIFWVIMFVIVLKNFFLKLKPLYKEIYWFCFFSIFFITIPAAFMLYNLGIAVRQKTMVVPFLFTLLFLIQFKSQKE